MRRLLVALLVLAALPSSALSARAWQTPAQLSGSGSTRLADAATAPDGRVAVAWSETSANGPEQLWLTIRSGLAPVVVDQAGVGPVAVAGAGTGEFVTAWEDQSGEFGGPLPHAKAVLWSPETGLGAPVDLGESGYSRPIAVAANAAGDMVVAFVRELNYAAVLHTAFRPAGGQFGEPVAVSQSGSVGQVDVGLSSAGAAVFAWQSQAGDAYAVWGSSRLAAGLVDAESRLSDPLVDALGPAVAVDNAGRAVAAYSERAAGRSDGWLRAKIRSATGAWSAAGGIDGYLYGAPDVGVDADGDAVLTWGHFTPSGGGGQLGPVRVAVGNLGTGTFEPGTNLYPLQTTATSPQVYVRSDGSAIIAYDDTTGDVRAARRAGTGIFEAPQSVFCPATYALPVLAGIDAAGTASLVYNRGAGPPGSVPLWLVSDAPADMPSPAACPPDANRKPYPIYDPVSPAPGQEVLIDVEGTRDPYNPTTWRWDLDADGTFERDTGTTPTTRYSWPTPGPKPWFLQVSSAGTGTSVYSFSIQVVSPQAYPPGPKPAMKPAAPAGADGTIVIPSGQRLSAVLGRGLRTTVSARAAGPTTVELWLDAKEAGRLHIRRVATRIGRRLVTLSAGVPTNVRISVAAKHRARLRKARRIKAAVVLVRGPSKLAVLPVTVKR